MYLTDHRNDQGLLRIIYAVSAYLQVNGTAKEISASGEVKKFLIPVH